MKRVFSGIKPSGEVTLGNYLGAMKRWAEISNQADAEYIYFVPNLHALTARPDPRAIVDNTMADVAWLLSMGVDSRKTIVFVQSQIAAHSELAWVLNNYVTMGELQRMTQFKDKSRKSGDEGQLVGMFDYPVLMAADILLYDADEVPVGEDQVQHIELARNIAKRFNELHGPTFKLPKATIQGAGARIMDLQDPSRKMSKSDQDLSGCILLADSMKVVEAKIMRAVTDSGSTILASPERPAMTNLLTIYSLLTGTSIKQLEKYYTGKGYAQFKADLAGVAVDALHPLQEKFHDLMMDRDRLLSILLDGGERANKIAVEKISQVKAKIGLI